jgi:hypothetical protein
MRADLNILIVLFSTFLKNTKRLKIINDRNPLPKFIKDSGLANHHFYITLPGLKKVIENLPYLESSNQREIDFMGDVKSRVY